MTAEELPGDDIVMMPIKGLIAASEQNGSEELGFVVFIRGQFKTVEENEEEMNEMANVPGDNLTPPPEKMSKEAKVAKFYQELVYYPFIRDIQLKCGLVPKPKAEIPDNL